MGINLCNGDPLHYTLWGLVFVQKRSQSRDLKNSQSGVVVYRSIFWSSVKTLRVSFVICSTSGLSRLSCAASSAWRGQTVISGSSTIGELIATPNLKGMLPHHVSSAMSKACTEEPRSQAWKRLQHGGDLAAILEQTQQWDDQGVLFEGRDLSDLAATGAEETLQEGQCEEKHDGEEEEDEAENPEDPEPQLTQASAKAPVPPISRAAKLGPWALCMGANLAASSRWVHKKRPCWVSECYGRTPQASKCAGFVKKFSNSWLIQPWQGGGQSDTEMPDDITHGNSR